MNTLQIIFKEYSRTLDYMGPVLAGEYIDAPFGSSDWSYEVNLEMSGFQTVLRLYFNTESYDDIKRLHTHEEIANAIFELKQRLEQFLNSFTGFRGINRIQNELDLIKYWSELEFNKLSALK